MISPSATALVESLETFTVAREILQEYNRNHDALGRFAPARGGGGGSAAGSAASGGAPDDSTSGAPKDIPRITENKAIKHYTEDIGGSSTAMRESAEGMLATGKVKPPPTQNDVVAATLLDSIYAKPIGSGVVHRGINLDDKAMAKFEQDLDMGAEMNLGIASFSKDKRVADTYSRSSYDGSGKHQVLITSTGYRGLSLGARSDFPQEKEVLLSGGPYRVIKVTRGGTTFNRRIEIEVEYDGA